MRNFAAVILVVTAGSLGAFLTGGVGVQLREDLGLEEGGLGIAVGAFFTAAALTSAVLGRVAERLGPSRAMRIAATATAASLFAIALAATSFVALVCFLLVAGGANALAQPAANVFVARTIPAERLGIAFALKQSGIPAATLLGGLAVPSLALTVGWRWAFFAGGCVALAGVAVTPTVSTAAPAAGVARERERLALVPLSVLAIGIGCGAAAAGGLGAFLANAAVDAGIGEAASGWLVSGGSAICIATRLAVGARADRRGGGHLLRVASMLAIGAAAYAGLAMHEPLAVLVATPIAFAAGWGWPGLFNLAIVRANPAAPGAASGVTQTGTYAGATAGPVAFGLIAEGSGYPAAWLLAAGLAAAGALTMLAGRSLLRRARDRTAAAALVVPA